MGERMQAAGEELRDQKARIGGVTDDRDKTPIGKPNSTVHVE
jgi:hypothetical protein